MSIRQYLLDGLTDAQAKAVKSTKRHVLTIAGAGSGKTEVMARRIAWWVGIDKVPKSRIVAFTFTERAAEEMKFRIRTWMEKVTPTGQDVSLGDMYVGTIHGYCLAKVREYWADDYHNYDVMDDAARTALMLRGFNGLLGLAKLKEELSQGQYATIDTFSLAYDLLHEHNCFDVRLSDTDPPIRLGGEEREWCKEASLLTHVGHHNASKAFSVSAARYYAYIRCRRFLDFSTSQTEFLKCLRQDTKRITEIQDSKIHLVVDEVQDINPVQQELIEHLVGTGGKLTAVGDHRQSIYGFRGAKVDIIGRLWERFKKATDSEVIDLEENFRSTPRIIDLANRWAATISPLRSMLTPPMTHGNATRKDLHKSHVALVGFESRDDEANWLAEAIKTLVPAGNRGTSHDKRDGSQRGLTLSDVAVLVRSSTSVRTYMEVLEAHGIPSVVRAGPDLFSQPEVLLLVGALGVTAGLKQFYGADHNAKSLPGRIASVLSCPPEPEHVLRAAAKALRTVGLPLSEDSVLRLLFAAQAIHSRIKEGKTLRNSEAMQLRTPALREFLTARNTLRRVFPQQLFHFLLSEAGVDAWDTCEGRGQTAMFHLGALSGLITGIETPGWTSPSDYEWQIIGLCQYGAEEGRVEEQPLIVRPDAVTISTIHAVKGLEFPAVLLADVNARRFPSNFARRKPTLPFEGNILEKIDVASLSDNENYDSERRLMYVALTRAERFLLISHSGKQTSSFIKELRKLVADSGGSVTDDSQKLLDQLRYSPKEHRRDVRLATSFSDLRYYLACPHDFYLRKVLGYAPTIDQAFGYGRGVHNLLRAVHSNPKYWSALASDRSALESEIQRLIDRGLFYLRYTTGDPADNMRNKGLRVVADYVRQYAEELSKLSFEPEKSFETLLEYEDGGGGALISGSIDIVRQDNPPRVTLIDFKSGDPDSDNHQKLDEAEMKLQVAIYAIAAKQELEYQPERGLVRYLDSDDPSKRELDVPLDGKTLREAKSLVAKTAARIRDRSFNSGPPDDQSTVRCAGCDFLGLCGMEQATTYKNNNRKKW